MLERITILCFVLFPFLSQGQISTEEQRGNKYYELFDYSAAVKYYKKTDNLSFQGKRKLAVSYSRLNQFESAEAVNKEIVSSTSHDANDVFNYVSILRMNKKYEESQRWMGEYERMVGMDQRIIANRITQTRINDLLVNQGNMKVSNLGFNTENQEYAPMFYEGSLVYSAPGLTSRPENQVNNTTKQNFLRLYILDTTELNSLRRRYFNEQQMGKYNEGVSTISADGKTMIFSGNDVSTIVEGQVINVQLYIIYRDSIGRWGNPVPFAHNNPKYSLGHPCLTHDGKTLYFASNREGTFGGSDIWKSELKSDNSWSEPVNLGSHVNTESNEFYPFFNEKTNNLFFASDGRGGLGGLDLFVIEFKGGNFDYAQNLGAPVNSSYDDFSFIANESCSVGYFASNRTGGKGSDDIYRFEITNDWMPKDFRTLAGKVTDDSGKTVGNATVSLMNADNELVSSAITDANGLYSMSFEHSNEKNVIAKSIYGELKQDVVYEEGSFAGKADFEFKLPKVEVEVKEQKTIEQIEAETAKVYNDNVHKGNSVYFNSGKWDLTEKGKSVLDAYARNMVEDPSLKIIVNSFADKRASLELNKKLSKDRLNTTIEYLVSKGVPRNRIVGNYFGATTQGVDYNDEKCECTDSRLELCRRADLKLLRD